MFLSLDNYCENKVGEEHKEKQREEIREVAKLFRLRTDEKNERNIGYWVKQKEDMTQVPKANVFDVAAAMDEEQE